MSRKGKHIIQQNKISTRTHGSSYIPGLVSIIAPCYNEEENIIAFLKEVAAVDLSPYRYEVIIVNDGSRDRSGRILEEMKTKYPELRVIHFSRNFGQQQALMAGIRAARGEVLVTLDIDLQQPPALIPVMIRLYKRGYQVIHAIPEYQSNSATWVKKLTSILYYKRIKKMGSEGVVQKSNDFRLLGHRVAAVLCALPERNLYIRGILAWICPVASYQDNNPLQTQDLAFQHVDPRLWIAGTINYHHRARQRGETKYTWAKMITLALDGLTATSIQPLRFGLFLGGGSILLAFGLSIWSLYMHLIAGQTVSGWTSLMIVVLFFSSMQFILLGLIGEYIGKIFLQVRGRPGHIPLEDDLAYDQPSKSYTTQDKKAIYKPHGRKANTSKGRMQESKAPLESRHPP